ncbi:MAG: LacI family DNA-binding transcriptional regulator [Pseudomonadota bacterium]
MARRVLRAGLPSITDVAAKAGVSPATVSRFHNSPGIVSPQTKARIEEAVLELGYKPHAARQLSGQRSGTIGLIVPTIDNAIFSEMIQAFSMALFRNARTMLVAAHNYDLAREAVLVESLLVGRIDGIALVGLEHTEATMQQLTQSQVPAVMVWNYRTRQSLPCIGVDNRDAGRMAMQHLLELGHQDILTVFAESKANDRAADRRLGAIAAAKDAGFEIPAHRRVVCPYDLQASKDLVMAALAEKPAPTAIFATNDVIAQGAFFAAMTLGVPIPKSLSIIGIGDFRGSSAFEPGLTTLRIPARRIGRHAADVLVEMLEWPNAKMDRSEKYTIELNLRGSTAPPPTSPRTGKRSSKSR